MDEIRDRLGVAYKVTRSALQLDGTQGHCFSPIPPDRGRARPTVGALSGSGQRQAFWEQALRELKSARAAFPPAVVAPRRRQHPREKRQDPPQDAWLCRLGRWLELLDFNVHVHGLRPLSNGRARIVPVTYEDRCALGHRELLPSQAAAVEALLRRGFLLSEEQKMPWRGKD
jgi:hypothetical protein